MSKGLIITLSLLGALALAVIGIYSAVASAKHTGIVMEQGLSAKYQDDQLELDKGVKQITEAMSIANVSFANQADVFRAALTGKIPASIDPATGKSAFMMVLQQNLPNVDTKVYQRIIDIDVAFRENFAKRQEIFRDQIRDYQTWLNDGIIVPMLYSSYFPSNNLEARIGKHAVYGKEALEQMKVLVTSADTDTSFETGHEAPIVMPGTPTKSN